MKNIHITALSLLNDFTNTSVHDVVVVNKTSIKFLIARNHCFFCLAQCTKYKSMAIPNQKSIRKCVMQTNRMSFHSKTKNNLLSIVSCMLLYCGSYLKKDIESFFHYIPIEYTKHFEYESRNSIYGQNGQKKNEN